MSTINLSHRITRFAHPDRVWYAKRLSGNDTLEPRWPPAEVARDVTAVFVHHRVNTLIASHPRSALVRTVLVGRGEIWIHQPIRLGFATYGSTPSLATFKRELQ